MSETLVNRVAESGLITLKPEEWIPSDKPIAFDLAPFLFQGLILREKDFREQMKSHDWNPYAGQVLCVYCSADAIIPHWAYMLVTSYAALVTRQVYFGNAEQWIQQQLLKHIDQLDIAPYQDQRVIIKGCSDGITIGPEIYIALTEKLLPVVKSLMFGEPCSTVPVFKRPSGR